MDRFASTTDLNYLSITFDFGGWRGVAYVKECQDENLLTELFKQMTHCAFISTTFA